MELNQASHVPNMRDDPASSSLLSKLEGRVGIEPTSCHGLKARRFNQHIASGPNTDCFAPMPELESNQSGQGHAPFCTAKDEPSPYLVLEDGVGFEPTYTGLRVRTVTIPVTRP